MNNKVIIAGAGIGDKDNLTIKVKNALDSCDIIIYDRLLNDDIISQYSDSKELYYVGKAASDHTLTQDQINSLMVEKAKEGKKIVRLKGGDPYVFGRGGEEALYLLENGIDFEVMPGLTSGIVCLNTAGIPATHRNLTTSITFITAHRAKNEEISFEKYAALDGTLVFYMGLNNLDKITYDLMAGGMEKDKKIAVIMNGAMPSQKVLVSTLENVKEDIKDKGFASPALIVVSDNINYRDMLNYFEKRPLFGKKILVTRAKHQIDSISSRLENLGAQVIKAPTIDITPTNIDKLEEDFDNFDYDYLIFTSVNSVKIFFENFVKNHDIRQLHKTKIATIGEKTRKEVEKYHLKVELSPEKYIGEQLVKILQENLKKTDKVYFPHSNLSREKIISSISEISNLKELAIYKTTPTSQIIDIPQDIVAVVFTSSSTVDNFVSIYGKDKIKNTKIFSIGDITSDSIKKHNLKVYKQSKKATIDSLIDAVLEVF